MLRQPLAPADYARSVVAVPPLAWSDSLKLAAEANAALVRHIEAGGVRILLYGGNANLYHIDLGRFRAMLQMLETIVAPGTAVIPSIGPDFGKMLDQAPIARESSFRDVMALPIAFPADPAGIDRGLRGVADALGFGLVMYIKRDGAIDPARLERLVRDGVVRFVKYAVERPDPAQDRYLADIVAAVGAGHVASGMGETPLPAHLGKLRLATFTSGGVCLAPSAAMALLAAYQAGDLARAEALRAPFLAFENVRSRLGGISVLHDAVELAGIARTGPILPMLSRVSDTERPEVRRVAEGLMAAERMAVAQAA